MSGPDPHTRMLGLAGQAPDGWLAIARETLALDDADRLHELFAALDGADTGLATEHRFETPVQVSELADRAVISVATAQPVLACWRTMRDGTTPVYLVQADPGADLAAVTSALQQALIVVGERSPCVEVFGPATPLPAYHEAALLAAALLWTAVPPAPVRVARTFDGATPENGPFFSPARELVVEADHRQKLLDFLAGGEEVLPVVEALDDVIAPGGAVPTSLRSDGVWVWSDASRYYLDRYLIAPDTELATHAAAQEPRGTLTHLERHRVRAALSSDHEEAPLWRAG